MASVLIERMKVDIAVYNVVSIWDVESLISIYEKLEELVCELEEAVDKQKMELGDLSLEILQSAVGHQRLQERVLELEDRLEEAGKRIMGRDI